MKHIFLFILLLILLQACKFPVDCNTCQDDYYECNNECFYLWDHYYYDYYDFYECRLSCSESWDYCIDACNNN